MNGERLKPIDPKNVDYLSTTDAEVGRMAFIQHPPNNTNRHDLLLQTANGDITPIAVNAGDVYMPNISADGKQIAYQVNDSTHANSVSCLYPGQTTPTPERYQRQIRTTSGTDWEKRDIIDGNPYGTDDWSPVWDPSGQRLAYVSRRECNFSVWIDDPDDGQAALLIDLGIDHDKIAYLSWGG